ncbi:MAG TPA: hypothetical protein ENI23_07055 [bacterium]|nr:hypothetical protein [bacterium]
MPLNKEILQPYKKRIFIESGTNIGEGVQCALDVGFEEIYSIEINEEFFKKSSERFRDNEKVNLIKGDSKEEFVKILRQIQEPATIWLDAHTRTDASIMEELEALQQHPIKDHIILIDDVIDFIKVYKEIKFNNLTEGLKKINPNYHLSFIDNTHYTNNILLAEEKRILHIDHFANTNTNAYWLKAFKKFGRVETVEIYGADIDLLGKKIMKFKPHHIHLGGSVKNNMVPLGFLSEIKRKINCTVSVLYGDATYSDYHSNLSKVVDYIYMTNKTHIRTNESKGLRNFKYIPGPTDPEVFKHYEIQKEYDVIFIGNNNQDSRLPILERLSEIFNLKVFGAGWEGTNLNFSGPVFGEEFSKVCSRAKISIGIVDTKGENLETYFSNRLANTLATGCFFINHYNPGMEKIFTNKKHLVWYKDEEELIELIRYYLVNEEEREKIATDGQKEVCENYTYEKSVKRILDDSNVVLTLDLENVRRFKK